ncbi:MAG TPA: hypothetical protein VJN93_16580 [Candidatus Acidoferrum sp.]|nr:hypothetical protein [Candidatus Acidoferrum sp.]
MFPRPMRLLAVLFFLTPGVGLAQVPATVVLSGYIREAGTGRVVGEARVELQNAMGTPIGFAYSDRNGVYQFNDIGGDCYLSVTREGYESVKEFVRPEGSNHVYKDVMLRLLNPAAAPKAVAPVSERELKIPSKAKQHFAKGIELIVQKTDYRGAVNEFARAISKYPAYYEAYAAMGLAQNKMGDKVAAEASLRKSISVSGEKYPQAMVDLASMLNAEKHFPDAEPLLRKAIALDKSSWRAQFELADTLAGENRFKEAAASASAARDLKPDNAQIYLLLYNLHVQSDDFASALADTQGYLKLSPTGAMADRVRQLQEQIQKNVPAAEQHSVSAAAPSSAPKVDSTTSGNGSASADALVHGSDKNSNFTPNGASDSPTAAPPASTVPAAAATTSTPPITAAAAATSAASAAPAPPAAAQKVPPSATAANSEDESSSDETTETDSAAPGENSGLPPSVDEVVPQVAVNVPCSLPTILHGTGRRAVQFLNSLERFDASERVEHYKLNSAGVPGAADVRSFDYDVTVIRDHKGDFQLQEYRNGKMLSPQQFPAGIATANLSVHALIFHPKIAPHFEFACEGLGEWKGRSTWLIHFQEKPDGVDSFRSYVINGARYPVRLVGRAWIDAKSYQVIHLESDLLKPVPKIRLTREHISIDYAAVRFRSNRQQLWLPQSAELYVELRGHRFYRKHTFSKFKIFSTDTTQQVEAPKSSYCFTNTSGALITGVLSATPVSGKSFKPASLTLSIPANSTVCKSVGAGKDVNIPIKYLAASIFAYDGPDGSIEAQSFLPDGRVPQLVSNRPSRQN